METPSPTTLENNEELLSRSQTCWATVAPSPPWSRPPRLPASMQPHPKPLRMGIHPARAPSPCNGWSRIFSSRGARREILGDNYHLLLFHSRTPPSSPSPARRRNKSASDSVNLCLSHGGEAGSRLLSAWVLLASELPEGKRISLGTLAARERGGLHGKGLMR